MATRARKRTPVRAERARAPIPSPAQRAMHATPPALATPAQECVPTPSPRTERAATTATRARRAIRARAEPVRAAVRSYAPRSTMPHGRYLQREHRRLLQSRRDQWHGVQRRQPLTQSDTCQSGTCAGANPVTCAATDACHAAGACDTTTGTCSNPTVPDGTACAGGNKCNGAYICSGGTCTGTNPVTCTASDQCHGAGTCDPTSGTCSNPTLNDGTACNDGNACTSNDVCTDGACAGQAGACGTPPTWPAGRLSVVDRPTSALLSWTAATDPGGIAQYTIFSNGSLSTTAAGTALTNTVTGLVTGDSYRSPFKLKTPAA